MQTDPLFPLFQLIAPSIGLRRHTNRKNYPCSSDEGKRRLCCWTLDHQNLFCHGEIVLKI